MDRNTFFEKVRISGGSAYLVGGAVRDALMGRACSDRDYVVCGLDLETFAGAFREARRAGLSFPVFLLEIDGETCEVAFARTDRKSGSGHKGFEVACGRDITIEQDLFRRDLTINSMAESEDGVLIDPYGGARDIRNGVIRAVSSHFTEDPVRALRAARQAAQFGFEIEERTLVMMKECAEELISEPAERKLKELGKALLSGKPSIYFRSLARAGLLKSEFPWLFALIGKSQPSAYHPEGDAFEHTMSVADAVSEKSSRAEVVFAALMHDIGKGLTPEAMLPHHYGHELRGLAILPEVAEMLKIPKKWRECAEFAIREHMRAASIAKPPKVRDFIRTLAKHPLALDGFKLIMQADSGGAVPEILERFEEFKSALDEAACKPVPEGLRGRKIGDFIRDNEIKALKKLMHDEKPS